MKLEFFLIKKGGGLNAQEMKATIQQL